MGDTKHLEMLQTNIQRLAGNGFAIKGWAVTLLTVILGLSLKDGRAAYSVFGLVPILLFWFLDGYYLALERAYRHKFVLASELARDGQAPTFNMTPPEFALRSVATAMWSPSSWILFVPALSTLIVSALFT